MSIANLVGFTPLDLPAGRIPPWILHILLVRASDQLKYSRLKDKYIEVEPEPNRQSCVHLMFMSL